MEMAQLRQQTAAMNRKFNENLAEIQQQSRMLAKSRKEIEIEKHRKKLAQQQQPPSALPPVD